MLRNFLLKGDFFFFITCEGGNKEKLLYILYYMFYPYLSLMPNRERHWNTGAAVLFHITVNRPSCVKSRYRSVSNPFQYPFQFLAIFPKCLANPVEGDSMFFSSL